MIDREKVIKSLKDSLVNQGCGYMDGVGELYAVSGEDLQNAIALLKEQEPRVLTLDEAFDLQGKTPYPCIFVDIKGRNDVFLAYISDEIYGDYHSDDFKVYRPWISADRIYHKTEYGKLIRFWNLFPTSKQRDAVKWE